MSDAIHKETLQYTKGIDHTKSPYNSTDYVIYKTFETVKTARSQVKVIPLKYRKLTNKVIKKMTATECAAIDKIENDKLKQIEDDSKDIMKQNGFIKALTLVVANLTGKTEKEIGLLIKEKL